MVRKHFHRWLSVGLPLLAALAILLLVRPYPSARAQTLPPRPTTQPTAIPRNNSDEPAPGRITGTVIDSTTGAPAASIGVDVGDVRVQTDTNGNYDRQGLPAGTYIVALALGDSEGTPEQAPIQVIVGSGQTVVQHLSFRSPAAATAVPAPSPTPAPVRVPSQLPNTGAADDRLLVLLVNLAILLVLGGAALVFWRRRA